MEIAGKRLELFKEVVPKAVRVAVLYDPANRGNVAEAKEVQTAGPPLELNIQSLKVPAATGLEAAFGVLSKNRPDGIYVPGGPLMNTNQKQIAAFASTIRLPPCLCAETLSMLAGSFLTGCTTETITGGWHISLTRF